MADDREPPPLFDEEESEEKDVDSDDLFPNVTDNSPRQDSDPRKDEDDIDDIFAEAQTEIPLDSPEKEKTDPEKDEFRDADFDPEPEEPIESIKEPLPSSPATVPTETTSTRINPPSLNTAKTRKSESRRQEEEQEEEENYDQFNLEISVTDPKKVGDGMTAYMAYKVCTKSTLPQFKRAENSVYRRFSDFLGLHEKLVEKHQPAGIIIPPPPEKSVLGATKIKMSKEESSSQDFVEKRRAALERFVNRAARHPSLREDSSFVEFLTLEGDLPKASSTSALSGAGVMRLFNKMGDSIGRVAFKMDETDQGEWFEDKQQQIESLDLQLKKLHSSVDALVQHRKELALNTGSFAKSIAMVGNAEEHTSLSRALSQLAEIEEKVDQLHMDQADADFFVLAELVKDYVSLIGSIKSVFHEREKTWKNWKEAEAALVKKREQRAKLELQRKLDKVPSVSMEITQLEDKVEKGQEDFEKISKNIRKELARFDKQRIKDFKNTVIHYLEALMNSQQQLIKYWESFLPEAKAIA